MLVHAIKPNGTRFEYSFPDGTPPEKILAGLARIKAVFGRAATKESDSHSPMDPGAVEDPDAPWAWDAPGFAVAVGTASPDGTFAETQRLKG